MKQITVLIVEDQIEHQQYFQTIIGSDSGFRNVGMVRLGADAVKLAKSKKPDIALIDLGLPDMSGIECIRQMSAQYADTRFLVCTVFEDVENIINALKAGARGYILKNSKPYQIIDALKDLAEGAAPISGAIASKILESLELDRPKIEARESDEVDITRRERDILQLLSKGHSYIEIADELHLSVKTIKWHIYKLYKKLHAKNRTEAINKFFGTN